MLVIELVKLGKTSVVPNYATDKAAGLDLHADETLHLAPGARAAIPTGLAIAIPDGYVGLICPRSGIALTHMITVLNAPGIIDSDYRGEIKVLLVNHRDVSYLVKKGDRIAQLVITPVARVAIKVVEILGDTIRDDGGFGSTGK